MMKKGFKQQVLELFSESTFTGANFIFSTSDSFLHRLWYFFFTIASIGCAALCYKGVQEYLAYEVRTNIHFDVLRSDSVITEQMAVPNFALCNCKSIKNSVYHYDPVARGYFFQISTDSVPEHVNVTQWKQDFSKYCPLPGPEEQRSAPIDFQRMMNGKDLFDELMTAMLEIWTSRIDMLRRCFWKGIEFPCNAQTDPIMFNDVYTDVGVCLNFVHDKEWIQQASQNVSYVNRRPHYHDLTVFLDLQQSQRCGHGHPDIGEGFFIAAYDRRLLAQTKLKQSNYRMHPGYEYQIDMKTVVTVRKTENLNRCTSKVYMSTDGVIPPLGYTKGTCEALILMKNFLQKCNCIAPTPKWFTPYINEQNMGFETKLYKVCSESINLMQCFLSEVIRITRSTLFVEDFACKDPCVQYNYVHTVSSVNKLTESYVKSFNVSPPMPSKNISFSRWIDLNVVIMNMNFDTQRMDEMVEIQLITPSDLLLYIASACGLFFGMSCISFFEVVYMIAYPLICYLFSRYV